MTSDARYILPLLNRTLDALNHVTMNVMQRNDAQQTSPVSSKPDRFMPKYLTDFQQISAENLTALLAKYHQESLFFGYDFDNVTYMASCKIPTSNGFCC